MKEEKIFFCIGRKWFDKVNGNTYFNSKVIDNKGNLILYTGYQYGYGRSYLYEAEKELSKVEKNFRLVDLGITHDKKTNLKNNNF